jgi:hypothetical protein
MRTLYARTLLFLFLALPLVPCPASAQTGPCPTFAQTQFQANPTRGCFNASSDHSVTDPVTGAAKVTRYDLQFFDELVDATNPATTPIQTSPLGKPNPVAGTTPPAIWFGAGTSVPLPAYPVGRRLKSVVVAVGPGGSSLREVAATSNPFGQSGPQTAPVAPSGYRLTPE